MANGVYGTMIPTLINDENIDKYIDIFYSYSPTRNSNDVDGVSFKRVESSEVSNFIRSVRTDNQEGENNTFLDNVVDGLYNLKLPSNIFGRKGFYTIYIKPREVPVTIFDVSILKDFPNVRGVVLDTSTLPDEIKNDAVRNNGLVGYRMILMNGSERLNDVRIVTSNNKCQPITNVSTTNNTKSYSYQYNDNSSYTFLTFTPSSALSFKANSTPYIGKSTQKVYFANTLFEPLCIEIEMVSNDADTLATMISGSQLRDLNNGLITTFDDNNNIFMQHEMSTLKRTETGVPQYEIREKRTDNIDFSQSLTDKLQ
jgi:hypothetical protein